MEGAAYFLPFLGATLGFRLLRRRSIPANKEPNNREEKSKTAPPINTRRYLGAFVSGQWTTSSSNTRTMNVLDPCTGQTIGEISCCSEDEAQAALKAAAAARKGWAAMSLARREQLILAFRDKLLEHKDELVELDILETGKVRKY